MAQLRYCANDSIVVVHLGSAHVDGNLGEIDFGTVRPTGRTTRAPGNYAQMQCEA
jgi:hypothetical protein